MKSKTSATVATNRAKYVYLKNPRMKVTLRVSLRSKVSMVLFSINLFRYIEYILRIFNQKGKMGNAFLRECLKSIAQVVLYWPN